MGWIQGGTAVAGPNGNWKGRGLHAALVLLLALVAAGCFNGGQPERTLLFSGEGAGQGAGSGAAQPIVIYAWNANSGISGDRGTHFGQIRFVREAIPRFNADIVALSELYQDWFEEIEGRAAEEGPVTLIRGTTGGTQKLAILFNTERFELLSRDEMSGVIENNSRRAPLVVGLRDRQSGLEFDVVAMHLYRGNRSEGPPQRAAEAMRLRQLLQSRGTRPVVVIGDANVDCPPATAPEGCEQAFHELVAGDFLHWVDFEERGTTTCHPRFSDMLDIALVSQELLAWQPRTQIHNEREYCDEMADGPHFPISLVLTPPAGN